MPSLTVSRIMDAPRPEVWAVLADFGDIARWNTALTGSRIVAGPETGIGAERRCDAGRRTYLQERVTAWQPERGLDMTYTHLPVPVHDARATFRLESLTGDRTRVVVTMDYAARGLWRLDAPLFTWMFRRAFRGVLRDLATHVEQPVSVAERVAGGPQTMTSRSDA